MIHNAFKEGSLPILSLLGAINTLYYFIALSQQRKPTYKTGFARREIKID